MLALQRSAPKEGEMPEYFCKQRGLKLVALTLVVRLVSKKNAHLKHSYRADSAPKDGLAERKS